MLEDNYSKFPFLMEKHYYLFNYCKESLATQHEILLEELLQANDGYEVIGPIPLYHGIGGDGYYILDSTLSSFYVVKRDNLEAIHLTSMTSTGDVPSGSNKTSPM